MFDKMKDLAKLKLSAMQGDDEAQFSLAGHYEGPKHDGPEAIKWYTKVANNRNSERRVSAMFNLGYLYYFGYEGAYKTKEETIDYYEAVRWFEKAAERGHYGAMSHLGVCYYQGKGTYQDYDEAVKWFRKSADAESGYVPSCCGLGECYLYGNGVEKNVSEAVRWYRKTIKAECYWDNDFNRDTAKKRLKELGYSV